MRSMRNIIIGAAVVIPVAVFSFLAGNQYAMRNEPLLIANAKANAQAAAAIAEFGKIVKETDWCEVNRLADDPLKKPSQ